MTGSSGRQRVAVDSFDDYLLVRPTSDISEKFGAIINPIMELMKATSQQSMTLEGVRDTLLPKLLSGQVRIPADQVKEMGSGKEGAQ